MEQKPRIQRVERGDLPLAPVYQEVLPPKCKVCGGGAVALLTSREDGWYVTP